MEFFLKRLNLFSALREALNEGYKKKHFLKDLQAGIIVGIVALPLGMALAIASGAPPQHGLYTVVISGVVVALFGGSRFQVTGPTAAFVVLLLPVVQKFGLAGLLIAGLISGIILVIMGVIRLGDVIQYVPHPVVTGFTSGIALVIATLQIKDFFGLQIAAQSAEFSERMLSLFHSMHTIHPIEAVIGLSTLILLPISGRFVKNMPSPIIALSLVTIGIVLLKKIFPDLEVANINSRFSYVYNGETHSGVPPFPPMWTWPWTIKDAFADGFALSISNIEEILPSSFAIALLGAIESLLSAVIADGMTQTKHNPNTELIALGIGNILCPFFGGIPATGALARTSTNIRFGAYSPFASMAHALVVLLCLIFLAPIVGYIPMAALAALLLFVAYNMSERHHFMNILRIGSIEDKTVLVSCFLLTVIFDMTIGVGVGIVLASMLFIRRISNLTQSEILKIPVGQDVSTDTKLPSEIFLYKITGPLFFGAAQKAMEQLHSITNNIEVVILDLTSVQMMDITGIVALDSSIRRLLQINRKIILVSFSANIEKKLHKMETIEQNLGKNIWLQKDLDAAKALAINTIKTAPKS